MIGEPLPLAEDIGSFLDYAYFSASENTLVYRAAEREFQVTWFDRNGRPVGTVGAPDHIVGLALSPDNDRALVLRHAPQNTVDQDLWLYDLARGGSPRRLTTAPTLEFFPTWQTNDRFVYSSGRRRNERVSPKRWRRAGSVVQQRRLGRSDEHRF